MPSHNSRAGHPAWLRCSSLKYAQYSRSSRLAVRAPRSGTYATHHASRGLAARRDVFELQVLQQSVQVRADSGRAAWPRRHSCHPSEWVASEDQPPLFGVADALVERRARAVVCLSRRLGEHVRQILGRDPNPTNRARPRARSRSRARGRCPASRSRRSASACARGESRRRAGPSAAYLAAEVLGEQRDVFAALAQRRQVTIDDVEPVEQVLAERASAAPRLAGRGSSRRRRARRPSPVACRRRARTRAPAARAAAWPGAGGSSPISSRKSVPPSACSKRPLRCAIAPVNAPRSWPKSSLSSSVSGSAAQLMATNGRRAPAAALVDARARQLLAGAALADDQDGARSDGASLRMRP